MKRILIALLVLCCLIPQTAMAAEEKPLLCIFACIQWGTLHPGGNRGTDYGFAEAEQNRQYGRRGYVRHAE